MTPTSRFISPQLPIYLRPRTSVLKLHQSFPEPLILHYTNLFKPQPNATTIIQPSNLLERFHPTTPWDVPPFHYLQVVAWCVAPLPPSRQAIVLGSPVKDDHLGEGFPPWKTLSSKIKKNGSKGIKKQSEVKNQTWLWSCFRVFFGGEGLVEWMGWTHAEMLLVHRL